MGNNGSRNNLYNQYYEALNKGYGKDANRLIENVDFENVDPYEVLGVPKNFDWEELKFAYKKVAKTVHPDKGGSEQVFVTVTKCFRKLADEFKLRNEQTHMQLRSASRDQNFFTSQEGKERVPIFNTADRNFNDRFNEAFEANRLKEEDGTSYHVGYGDIMAASTGKIREDFTIDRVMQKYNRDDFNKLFESTVAPATQEIIKYEEPEALPLARGLMYTELGGSGISDFSSTAEGEAKRTIQYTDYKRAFETQRLIDPRAMDNVKEYSMKEYEVLRENATARPQTEKERLFRERRDRQDQMRELERKERLSVRDNLQSLHFQKVTQQYLQ